MSSFRIRPRFKKEVPYSQEKIIELVEESMETSRFKFKTQRMRDHLVFKIPAEDLHFWSPQLSLSFEDSEDGGTIIRGHYGPNPTVWAFFFYGYSALGILALFAGMLGLSQFMLKQDSWILWSLPVMGAIALGLYLIAQFGQKLGAEQMYQLHHFFEETIQETSQIE